LIPNPILKVLSTLSSHGVRHLLMGGQACLLYGAAEFSRDVDIVVVVEADNMQRLSAALAELEAQCIAVPPFDVGFLLRGHAIHFRCGHPDAARVRIDVMCRMRGVDEFDRLWERRTTIASEAGIAIEMLSLPDLVRAKKTQRDKDWPMIRRLVESSYAKSRNAPSAEEIDFWLLESRTPRMLMDLAARFPDHVANLTGVRLLLAVAMSGDESRLAASLEEERKLEQERDRAYWAPLLKELEEIRRRKRHDESAGT
jgi:hypothetical protein